MRLPIGGLLYLAVLLLAVAGLFTFLRLPDGWSGGGAAPAGSRITDLGPREIGLPVLSVLVAGAAGVVLRRGFAGLGAASRFVLMYRVRDLELLEMSLRTGAQWMLAAGGVLGMVDVLHPSPGGLPGGSWALSAPLAGIVLGRLLLGGLRGALAFKRQDVAASPPTQMDMELAMFTLLVPVLHVWRA